LGNANTMMARWHAANRLRGFTAALLLCLAATVPARADQRLKIETLSLFVAEPGSSAELEVRVGPTEALPKNAYVRIRGLPASATISDGFAVTPGVWSVPLAALATLRVALPRGVSGRSELTISLLDMDGKVLAETRSALVVAQVNLRATLAPDPKPEPKLEPIKPDPPPVPKAVPAPEVFVPPAAAPSSPERRPSTSTTAVPPAGVPAPKPVAPPAPPAMTAEVRQRNARMVEQGDKALAQGNIASARQFYLRAADAADGAACLKLAETYDPAELGRLKAQGIVGDPVEAKRWYERARDLGIAAAIEKLARLAGR
jgi:hypothetical protein